MKKMSAAVVIGALRVNAAFLYSTMRKCLSYLIVGVFCNSEKTRKKKIIIKCTSAAEKVGFR